ncbi:hypothetical protein MTP99_014902 [Tenebrio molitor]|jgi:hypothetical protein|nr:hypothetical protein MTP99_014902 [Tenebrio molitor]
MVFTVPKRNNYYLIGSICDFTARIQEGKCRKRAPFKKPHECSSKNEMESEVAAGEASVGTSSRGQGESLSKNSRQTHRRSSLIRLNVSYK